MSMVRWIFVVIIAMLVGFFIYVDLNSDMPEGLGVTDGLLLPCPDTPNCISTQASPEDVQHYAEPILYKDTVKAVQLKLEKHFLESGNARLVDSRLGYSHIVVESDLFDFQDDLELYFPEADRVMHVRSASRVGYDDLNVNRERVRQIRDLLVD